MGRCDAHKGDGSREGGDAGGENAGKQNQLYPEPPYVHPHVLGIHLSHLISPNGLGQQKGESQGDKYHPAHDPHIVPAGAGEAAQRPVVEVDDIGVVRKRHREIRDSRADVADHHSADDQHAHLLRPSGQQQNEPHGQHGAHKRAGNQRHGPRRSSTAEQKDHQQRHRQLGP